MQTTTNSSSLSNGVAIVGIIALSATLIASAVGISMRVVKAMSAPGAPQNVSTSTEEEAENK